MPKIALLKTKNFVYYENSEVFITAISEWEEVTEEELRLLRQYYSGNRGNRGYTIVDFVDNQRDKIDFAVKAQLEFIKAEEEKKQKEKEERAAKALARKHKLEQKKLEEKKELFEALKKELGGD